MTKEISTTSEGLEAGWNALAYQHLVDSAKATREVAETSVTTIVDAALAIAHCFSSGNKLLICGNGGSAADAQHVSSELVNRLRPDLDRHGLPAIALTTDTSFITAYANDCGYDGVFERQVSALGKPGDALMAISTSGNSVNVLKATASARNLSMTTIGLAGENGKLIEAVDHAIVIHSKDTQHIQEAMLAIEHTLCLLIETVLFG